MKKNLDPNRELVKAEDVCSHFKISNSTLQRMKKSGSIPFVKYGKTYRFNIDEVQQALFKQGRKRAFN
ncbi:MULTISPECIES: excisionase family DNA-binding protein [Sphingobacterium]|uniref:Excisionase family DNA-binding protein n=1 Tax=Sphingobacterium tenebrionis TaxID=3111775 RepID=A0ABU8I8T6_9SPHI|nr:excisionase family DNA-binding protein [Sphingobacterium sp. CZ-2]QBR11469.1 helix-turn-helix domain-containing protein [Sphingobacterium sp. CZ-2]